MFQADPFCTDLQTQYLLGKKNLILLSLPYLMNGRATELLVSHYSLTRSALWFEILCSHGGCDFATDIWA